jgi:hypothetical protein
MNKLDNQLVLDIIKTASKSGVVRLKFGDLEIEFAQKPSEPLQKPEVSVVQETAPVLPVDVPTIELQEDPPNQEEQKTIAQIEQIVRETEIENLRLENPLLYEQLVAQGEIEDGSIDEDDDEVSTTSGPV